MHDLWHKMVGILMIKMGVTEVKVTSADVQALIDRFPGQTPAIVFFSKGDTTTLMLLPESEARKKMLQ